MAEHVPKVSIGLPVFNGENFLPGALNSLLEQEFDDFELVMLKSRRQLYSTNSCYRMCRPRWHHRFALGCRHHLDHLRWRPLRPNLARPRSARPLERSLAPGRDTSKDMPP